MSDATETTLLPSLSLSSIPVAPTGENQPSEADWMVALPFRSAVACLTIQGSSGVLATIIGSSQTKMASTASVESSRHRRRFRAGRAEGGFELFPRLTATLAFSADRHDLPPEENLGEWIVAVNARRRQIDRAVGCVKRTIHDVLWCVSQIMLAHRIPRSEYYSRETPPRTYAFCIMYY